MGVDPECTCPFVRAGDYVSTTRCWDDMCAVHGVGTEYFRGLASMPYGYRDERGTSREEWEALRREEAGDGEED
jgi:hypothetical protein